MGKNPAFLFYPDNYIMGTTGFTFEQKGKYVELLCIQFSKGGYLKERDIKKILDFENESDQEVLDKFNKTEEGNYFNVRLLDEIIKRNKYSKKQSENAKKRWKKDTTAMPSHSEGNTKGMHLENTHINKNVNKYGKYKNVLITEEDYKELQIKYPEDHETPWDVLVEFLSEYIKFKNGVYNSDHYAAMDRWVTTAVKEKMLKDRALQQKEAQLSRQERIYGSGKKYNTEKSPALQAFFNSIDTKD